MTSLHGITCLVGLASFATAPRHARVRTGIDVLRDTRFAALRPLAARHSGKLRLGILAGPMSIDVQGRRTIDIPGQDGAAAGPGLAVVRLLSGGHGSAASVDGTDIDDTADRAGGFPVVDLYGAKETDRRPLRNRAVLDQVEAVRDTREIAPGWQAELVRFKARRAAYPLH